MWQKTTFAVIIFLFLINLNKESKAQNGKLKPDYYNFIHYKKNHISFPGDSTDFNNLFDSISDMIIRGKRNINVVHIGGSHIEAGGLPGRMAKRLQEMAPGMKGGRGFVFPYSISRTNNPRTYKVKYKGRWESCRNVERKKDDILGLSGIRVSTTDENANLQIILKAPQGYTDYDFNKVRIIHETSERSFTPMIADKELIDTIIHNPELGYTDFKLKEYKDTLNLYLKKDTILQDKFVLHGIVLGTDDPGFIYHGIGVNGASIPSYLRCSMLEQHTKILSPDLIILTLGTNDAYTRKFNPAFYEANYNSLIYRLKAAAPNAALLLTVPNDSYLYKRYLNKNTEITGKVIRKLAQKHGAGVWDFYNIMGGLNSISLWLKEGLASRDKIHLRGKGYFLQADMLFNAFLEKYSNYLENKDAEYDKTAENCEL